MIRCKDLNEAILRANTIISRDEARHVDFDETLTKLNQLVIGTNANDLRCRAADMEIFEELDKVFSNIAKFHIPSMVVSGGGINEDGEGLNKALRIITFDKDEKTIVKEYSWEFKTVLGCFKAYTMFKQFQTKAE